MPEDDAGFLLGAEDIYPRQRALFDQYEAYLIRTLTEAFRTRGRFWNRDFSSPQAYEASVEPNRQHFLSSLGGWPWERQALNPRPETVKSFSAFTLERVTYRLFDTIETDALLLTPRGRGPFPAVLCQVGVNGAPERICGFDAEVPDGGVYRRIGARLAAHGYVVLGTRMATGFEVGRTRDLDHRAPHLQPPARAAIRDYLLKTHGKDVAKLWDTGTRARIYLDRLCRMIGRNLMGMEMFALSRGVDLLQSLSQVDPERIGMYGLSQGGMSALFLGALEKRLKAVVASASFNDRFIKQVTGSPGYAPVAIGDSEDHIFPHLAEFDDSDLASLICPRCFFVESGRQDDAVDCAGSAAAFGRVKAIYERLGIPERCGRCEHPGGHAVEDLDDVGRIAFVQFLDQWLKV